MDFPPVLEVVSCFVVFIVHHVNDFVNVYYHHGSIDDGAVHDLGDLDREAVKSIFTTMAKCISNVNNNMQILVLEHADSSIYGDVQGVNEVCIWRNGEKLIPLEWIQ